MRIEEKIERKKNGGNGRMKNNRSEMLGEIAKKGGEYRRGDAGINVEENEEMEDGDEERWSPRLGTTGSRRRWRR